jgi:hypothetical protein
MDMTTTKLMDVKPDSGDDFIASLIGARSNISSVSAEQPEEIHCCSKVPGR